MSYYKSFFWFILLFTTLLMAWVTFARIQDFENSHVAIAEETTASVAEAIGRFIEERRHNVRVFVSTHKSLLEELVNSPDDDSIHELIKERLVLFFPNHFAYTLSDEFGVPLFEDFDGLIGQQCLAEISTFNKLNEHLPKVHPNSEMYHFDIMVPMKLSEVTYTFFVSFDADLLGNILKNSSVPGHDLLLVLEGDKHKLIEVNSDGSRAHLQRNDFRMTGQEQDLILLKKRIVGTSWTILDLLKPKMLSEFSNKLIAISATVYLIFIIIIATMYRNIKYTERMKAEADKNKAEFLSTVSHELRTPLTSIKGALALIHGGVVGELPEKVKELNAISLKNANRLIDIVNELLDSQKIEAGKFSIEKEDCNLSELIKDTIKSVEEYGLRLNVRYLFEDNYPDQQVNVDPLRFTQVLSNLLSNAAKYGRENDSVVVQTNQTDRGVKISVTDHGSGIPPDMRELIFKKYSQLKSKQQNKVNSTGLGLFIAKHIIDLHGGEIGFESEKDGTSFFIILIQ